MKGIADSVMLEMVRTDVLLGRETDLEPVFVLASETLTERDALRETVEHHEAEVEGLEDEIARLKDSLRNMLTILIDVEHEKLDKWQTHDVDEAWKLVR